MAGGGLGPTIYQTLFKKSSRFTVVMLAGAFLMEGVFDVLAESLYNNINRGKLWHHIKDNYKDTEDE